MSQSTVFCDQMELSTITARHPRRADARDGGPAGRAVAASRTTKMPTQWIPLALLAAGLVALALDLVLRARLDAAADSADDGADRGGGSAGSIFPFSRQPGISARDGSADARHHAGVARAAGEIAADAGARLDGANGNSGSRLCLSKEDMMKLGAIGALACDRCDRCWCVVLRRRSGVCAGRQIARRRRREHGHRAGACWRRRT